MYVTTFYSFKGGVGRTMALANVAVDLASRGRRVLAVDFDLEAPGLDTFDLLRPAGATPGVIDYVRAYLDTGQAPHVEDYVFESPGTTDGGGSLWIMPAGAHRRTYATTLAQIDWGALYEHHDGYLLFEDLKEQWKEIIKPHYVLIDSRTGHTDVGGICTRQLPDAVVILFFPNAQNLRGLTKIVGDIRTEPTKRDNPIRLHYVMSNVPDLDDEDNILKENITAFQRDLRFQLEPLVVHRYDSLSLLNQVIFTKDRPRSRLAQEYRDVTKEVIRLNPEDRDGALDYIAGVERISHESGIPYWATVDAHIKKIERHHSREGEVLYRLGSLRADDGAVDDAVALFTRAIDADYREPEVYLGRAAISRSENADREAASRDAMQALQSDRVSLMQVRRAISMMTPEDRARIANTPAVSALPSSHRVPIAAGLDRSMVEAATASEMLRPLLASEVLSAEERTAARQTLSLAAIALGRFAEAIAVIRSEGSDVSGMSIEFAFNYGMAIWGDRGTVDVAPFHRVVELGNAYPRKAPLPNFRQCMAVSHWAIGDAVAARNFAKEAKEVMLARRGREFSCWRYLRVSAGRFAEDTNELLAMIDGDDTVTPRFMHAERPPVAIASDSGMIENQ